MKIKRKIWALLLSAAMIITMMPAMAFAETAANGNTDTLTQDAQTASAEPVKVRYEGPTLRGVVGTGTLTNLDTDGISAFVVTYSDGSEKTFVYTEKHYPVEGDEEDDVYGAFLDADDPDQDPKEASTYLYAEVKQSDADPVSFEEEWNDNVTLEVTMQYAVNGDNDGEEELKTKTMYTIADVLCVADSCPTAVEFVPADGFTPECTVGYNYLIDDIFYGEGNKFVVSCYGWTEADSDKGLPEGYENFTTTYYYAKDTNAEGEEVEGFFVSGNVNRKEFVIDDGAEVELGLDEETDAEFTYSEYIPAFDRYETVPFTVSVKATKYAPDLKDYCPTFKYTGSVITPTYKLYDHENNLIPADAYDVTHADVSEMGYYDAVITFNDNFEYKDIYVDSVDVWYGIGPQAPVISKLVAGKKSLTVKWKKLTSAQLKNIDGFYIELATNKSFTSNYKRVYVSKKVVKSGKKLVKSLKKGKKYFVRIYAYKTITQDGYKFKMASNYSKVKAKKTK